MQFDRFNWSLSFISIYILIYFNSYSSNSDVKFVHFLIDSRIILNDYFDLIIWIGGLETTDNPDPVVLSKPQEFDEFPLF